MISDRQSGISFVYFRTNIRNTSRCLGFSKPPFRKELPVTAFDGEVSTRGGSVRELDVCFGVATDEDGLTVSDARELVSVDPFLND